MMDFVWKPSVETVLRYIWLIDWMNEWTFSGVPWHIFFRLKGWDFNCQPLTGSSAAVSSKRESSLSEFSHWWVFSSNFLFLFFAVSWEFNRWSCHWLSDLLISDWDWIDLDIENEVDIDIDIDKKRKREKDNNLYQSHIWNFEARFKQRYLSLSVRSSLRLLGNCSWLGWIRCRWDFFEHFQL